MTAGHRDGRPSGSRPAGAGPGTGVCLVEGWRGAITTRDGTLARAKPVDPSFFNRPAPSR
jgi:hypothetical protein